VQVINTLAPVVLIILLGVFLRRSGFMPERKAIWASNLTYWIALPALLFLETARAQLQVAAHFDAVLTVLGGMAACILVGYATGLLLRLPASSMGALVQAGFRGNLAFIGIPVVMYSMAAGNTTGVTLCILLIAIAIPIYNIVAVLVLVAGQHRFSLRMLGAAARQIATNPLVIACLAGVGVAAFHLPIPTAVERTVDSLGRMATPLPLLSIGVTLDFRKIQGLLAPVLAATLIKIAVSPLAGVALGWVLGLTREEMHVSLLLLATPTAAASFVMAENMGNDAQLTAASIVLSTVLSLGPLLIVAAVFAG